MSDFLKNLKSGQDKRPVKPRPKYDRGKYSYDSQQYYLGNEKRTGSDRRNGKYNYLEGISKAVKELAPAVRIFLKNASENQARMVEIEEMRAKAEMDKAEALKEISMALKNGAMGSIKAGGNEKVRAKKPLDQNRKKILKVISSMRDNGETFENIAIALEKEEYKTFSGRGRWHAQTVHRLYQDHILN